MSISSFTFDPVKRAAALMLPRTGVVLGVAVLFAATAIVLGPGLDQHVMGLVALVLCGCAVWILILSWLKAARHVRLAEAVRKVIEHDDAASIVTAADGAITCYNDAAERACQVQRFDTLNEALAPLIANPDALIYRLRTRAELRGSAYEKVITGTGHMRLSVHRAGDDTLIWRVENSGELVALRSNTATVPALTIGRNNAILSMNDAARPLISEGARTLDQIFPTLPLRSGQLNKISTRSGMISCIALELEGIEGRREIVFLPSMGGSERPAEEWMIFDELPVPLLKLTREGTIELCNRPAADLLGCDAAEGRLITDLLEGLGRSIPDWLEDAALERGVLYSEFLRVRRPDREVFIQVTLNRATENGEVILIAVLSDATELKSLEAQFVQSQKMQAIGQLAGGIAHDFNNLLTAISGHCDLLLLRHDQGDADYSDLLQINQNANRAASLVNQLLAYSRKQTLRPEIMDLRDAMSDLTHLLNRLVGEKMVLTLKHDPALWSIRADKRQFEQVVMNLVVNARDAMPYGGEIRIESQNITLDEPLLRDNAIVAAGRWVRISVRDEGTGIPQDRVPRLFEPFFTTKRTGEGTGLGLSTAYGIVKQTGGFIFVDSQEGVGTTFFLMFPAHEAVAPRPEPERKPQIDRAQAEGLVLLVEDEAPVRAFASRALQLRGFTVLEAESAEEALDILEDREIKVDVFVTDVVMPGMDGPTWVQEALKMRPDVRVVFVSGYAEEDFGDTQARIPNSVFLPKPFSLADLTQVVQQQMSG